MPQRIGLRNSPSAKGYIVRNIESVDSGAAAICPFVISVVKDKVLSTAGTVNGFIPSNIFTSGKLTKFSLTGADTHYVVLNVTTNGKQVTAVTIGIDTSPPANANANMGSAPTDFKHCLAVIGGDTNRRTVFQIAVGNVICYPKEIFKESKTPTTDGSEPFNRWYSWEVFQYC